ncbi:MAG: RiPP maturation radical SAM C-methyltransferase [Deltaproteobacteria bacterium]|nr:RiPP maturation radical SAM C-methyltransferase [Deltaproteobacteria bacterium]
MKAADLCLVYMPYSMLHFPPFGISILHAEAEAQGLRSTIADARFWFADRIELHEYVGLTMPTPFMLGEYTFSRAAFPGFNPDYPGFLASELPRHPNIEMAVGWFLDKNAGLREVLEKIREKAERFIPEAAERILALGPRIVGCGSSFQQHCASLALLRKIKEWSPDTVTVMGGANCEGAMGRAAARLFPWVDRVCSGDGDRVFIQFCRQVLKNGKDSVSASLPGMLSCGDLSPSDTAFPDTAIACEDMDHTPIPDFRPFFETLRTSRHASEIHPSLLVETSRGCRWAQKKRCSFCAVNGMRTRYRIKSSERVLRELREQNQRYGLANITLTDSMLEVRRIGSWLGRLSAGEDRQYRFFAETAACLNQAQVRRLARAGFSRIQPGIESLDDRALRLLGKHSTAIQNVALLKYAMENGIAVLWNILCHIPGEKPEWYAEMAGLIPLLTHLQPPMMLASIRFDRFSPYHDNPSAFGLRLSPLRAYRYLYNVPDGNLAQLANYFEDTTRIHTEDFEEHGIGELRMAVLEWQQVFGLHQDSVRSVRLTARDDGERTEIVDLRPQAPRERITLTKLHHFVHLQCASPMSRESIARNLERRMSKRIDPMEIDAVIRDLEESRLLLVMSGKHLSLALREPVRPLPKQRDFLVGCNIRGYLVR